ncbi:sortase domain-bontaining protein [Vagococcus bubulae]|uniref:Sortase n=1 Tax=Vagococcus bubulae TaxID=1977868 RepID=A0A429ZL97_9ENTE|nr:sortase [Vagococcus bubulae]RST94438.1 hypothetical protein CBF36_05915 [Vagococcus bubulae]
MTKKTNQTQPTNLNETESMKKRKKRKHKQSSNHSSHSTGKKVIRDGKVVIKKRRTHSTNTSKPNHKKIVDMKRKQQVTTKNDHNKIESLHKKRVKRISAAAILIATLGLGTTAAALDHQASNKSRKEIRQTIVTAPHSMTFKSSDKQEVIKKIETIDHSTDSKVSTETSMPTESQEIVQDDSQEWTVNQEQVPTNKDTTAVQAQPAMSLNILGQIVYYQNGGQAAGQSIIDANSDYEASTWGGAQTFSGNDGMNTHFIGHNPGAFSIIFSLSIGNQIVVTDSTGTPKTYIVNAICQVTDDGRDISNGAELYDTITGTDGGERITLQSCVNDDVNLIIFASAQ